MRPYQIDSTDTRVYPMGLTRTEKGIHAAVAAAAKECSLLLYAKKQGKNSGKQGEPIRGSHSRRKAAADWCGRCLWQETGLTDIPMDLRRTGRYFPTLAGPPFSDGRSGETWPRGDALDDAGGRGAL